MSGTRCQRAEWFSAGTSTKPADAGHRAEDVRGLVAGGACAAAASSATRIKWRRCSRVGQRRGQSDGNASAAEHRAPPAFAARPDAPAAKNVTSAETGLPGSPKNNFSSPASKGERFARPHRNLPEIQLPANLLEGALTQSISPTETPPVVMTTSHSVKARSKDDLVAAKSSGTRG